MPRFSEHERERIRGRLLAEGERLFTAHGIKRVTIDELAGAANIAKASFYTFYDSKEALYLDIAQTIQLQIFKELETVLESSAGTPNRERVRQVFAAMQGLMFRYPILTQIDSATVELIARKVPQERLNGFAVQNLDATRVLMEHGIRFSCGAQTASAAFQALYHGWIGLQGQPPKVQAAVADLLLNGVIRQIVID